ncbi:MAG: threonine aldolase, partial [Gammaproteobacteria bacterium]|nr:threonine aldolase [Gammaproteobacteria bacterium]
MAESRGVAPRPVKTQFASDNWSGLCPQAMKALIEANEGFMAPYGSDLWTQKACDALSEFFETKVQVYFLATGTAANALALAQLTSPTGAVVCHPFAHIRTDECGAPGFLNPGMGLIPCDGPQGKIAPASLSALLERSQDLRHQPPRVLSLTQTTEVGTLYSLKELEALTQCARSKNLKIHMDGARLMNAIVAQDRSPADLTWRLGVDALALGGSKNGGGCGDAIIFFNSDIANDFGYRVKQGGHLSAKMRLVAAPFLG